jgi:hypothetical protein
MPDLKDKVFAKIDHEKPISHNYFVAMDVARALAITVIFFLGGVLLAFLLWDWVLIPQIIDFTIENIIYISLRLLPLVLIIVVLFSLLGYYLYRQTDWLLVQKRVLVGVLGFIAVLLIAIVGLVYIKSNVELQNSLESFDKDLQKYALQPPRPKGLTPKIKTGSVVLGKIVMLDRSDDTAIITVDDRTKLIVFQADINQINNLKIGDLIKLEFHSGNPPKIIKITKIERTEVIFDYNKTVPRAESNSSLTKYNFSLI